MILLVIIEMVHYLLPIYLSADLATPVALDNLITKHRPNIAVKLPPVCLESPVSSVEVLTRSKTKALSHMGFPISVPPLAQALAFLLASRGRGCCGKGSHPVTNTRDGEKPLRRPRFLAAPAAAAHHCLSSSLGGGLWDSPPMLFASSRVSARAGERRRTPACAISAFAVVLLTKEGG